MSYLASGVAALLVDVIVQFCHSCVHVVSTATEMLHLGGGRCCFRWHEGLVTSNSHTVSLYLKIKICRSCICPQIWTGDIQLSHCKSLPENQNLQVMHMPTNLDMCCTITMYLCATLTQNDTQSPNRFVHFIARKTKGSHLTSCYCDDDKRVPFLETCRRLLTAYA